MEANSVPRTPALSVPRSRRLLAALSDERLVEQVRRGNDAAFEAIYDRHSRGILGFCRHMLASTEEAEDAVQHTFIQAHGALGRGDREIHLKAWLYTIARNRCLSILRARREQAAELEEIPTAGLSEEVQQRSDLRELLADIRALPEEQRAALVLSEVGDLSHSDIAAVVGCDVRKVKALVYQARTSLIETRNARETPCHEIREQLATATGGALRRGPLRRHVKECEGCAQFRDDVRRQRAMLAVALPVLPSLALKKGALTALGIGGGAGGAGAAGGGAAGGGLATLIGSGGVAKTVAVVTLAGATAAGGLALTARDGGKPDRPEAAQAPAKPGTPAAATGDHARYASATRHQGASASTGHAKRHHGAANGGAKHKHGHGHGRSQHGAGGTETHGNGGHGHLHGRSSQTPAATTPHVPPANGNAGSHPPATTPQGGGSSGNNGRHLGSENGNGSGHAYGHDGTPAQPPSKPADAGPPADAGNSGTAPGQVKPEKPVKENPLQEK
jgi:RNA polymerase sigma factor (sigma-70 family)